MSRSFREFQIFAKPAGANCNLNCSYCYYLEKEKLFPEKSNLRMPYNILEEYIKQHINASLDPTIYFSWHGVEPTILGLDYYRKIVEFQEKYKPDNKNIVNGIQTNGTLLNDEWCDFFVNYNQLNY